MTHQEITNLLDKLMTLWNTRDYPLACEIYADDYQGLDVTDQTRIRGPEGSARQLQRFVAAFPDLNFQVEQTLIQDHQVAVYWCARGTHQGTLLNIPATGRIVEINGVTMLRVADGKIKTGVHLWDMAALLRTIGLLPELERKPPLDTLSLKDALTICG